MAAKPGSFSTSFNAGEFSEDLAGRIDLKQYYSAALRMKGLEAVPQAGFQLLPGSRLVGYARGAMVELPRSDVATNYGATPSTRTIWTATVSGPVAAVDLLSISASGPCALQVQTLSGSVWSDFGPQFTASADTPRRTAALPPGEFVTTAGVRVVCIVSGDAVTVALGDVLVFDETADCPVPRFVALQSDDATYMLTAGPGIVDVYRLGAHVGAVRVPGLTTNRLATLDAYAEAETVGLFHPYMRSVRLLRHGTDWDWSSDPWPFDDIPRVDLGGTYEKTADVWEIFIRWASTGYAISLVLTVDDETAPAVTLSTDIGSASDAVWDAFAADMVTALEGLPSLGPGVAVEWEAGEGYRLFTVTFGGELAGAEYGLSATIANTSEVSALPTHTAIGETIGEPLFSESRGWPATATLVQDRLTYGGCRGRPSAVLFSETGEYFSLNIESQKDSSALLDAIRSQSSEAIRRLVASKYLIVFTDRRTYFVPNRTISRDEPRNFVESGANGVRSGTDVVEIDGRLFYIAPTRDASGAETGNILFSCQYDDVSTSYEHVRESLLASHLVKGISGLALQKATAEQDAPRLWLVRDDGRVVVAAILQSEKISAFSEWLTCGGTVRGIGTDPDNVVWIAVERNGALLVERLEAGLLYQSAMTGPAPGGVLSGLDHLDGCEVWSTADGWRLGPWTVEMGRITLDEAASAVIAGLWQPPVWESMPRLRVLPDDTVLRRPGRIHTATVSIMDTTSIAIGANGESPEDVPLFTTSDPVDTPLAGKSELVTVSGLDGVVDGPTLVITQTHPGTLRVRDITIGERL